MREDLHVYILPGIAYKRFGDDSRYSEGENDSMMSFSTDRGTLDMRIEGEWDRGYPKMLTPRASTGTIMLGNLGRFKLIFFLNIEL